MTSHLLCYHPISHSQMSSYVPTASRQTVYLPTCCAQPLCRCLIYTFDCKRCVKLAQLIKPPDNEGTRLVSVGTDIKIWIYG